MNSTLRQGDDDGKLYFFLEDQDEGSELEIIDGAPPVFAAAGRQHEIPFLFGICAGQEARTALYEFLEDGLLVLIIRSLEEGNWVKAVALTTALSEADAYRVMKYKRTAP